MLFGFLLFVVFFTKSSKEIWFSGRGIEGAVKLYCCGGVWGAGKFRFLAPSASIASFTEFSLLPPNKSAACLGLPQLISW